MHFIKKTINSIFLISLIFFSHSAFSQTCGEYIADDFNTNSYSNNTGSTNWSGSWTEDRNGGSASDPDGTSSGMIRIDNNQLRFEGISGADPYLYRQANLASTLNPTLCFDIHTSGNLEEAGSTDEFKVEISSNGGTSWTTLETFNGDITASRSYNIAAYTATNTQIRFFASAQVMDGDEYFYIDNVEIKYEVSNPTGVYGYAWEDWDYDGTMDESCIIPICGIQVEIWSCSDVLIGTTATDGSGNWSYDLSGMPLCETTSCDSTFANSCIRVEYSLPDSLCHYNFTQFGPHNGTSIQFIKPGDCAPIGAARPDDYCEDNNPTLLTSCFASIRPESTSNEPAIVFWEYNDNNDQSYTAAAYYDQVGSIYGIAKNNIDNDWYYGSLIKRHTGLGPDGIGAIYMQTDITNTSSVSTVYDFGSAAGSIGSNAARGLPTTVGWPPTPSFDTDAFGKSAKEGIGDIEYCTDTKRLYAVNLLDRKVYAINPSDSSAVALGTMPWISSSPCNDGTARPWGLKKYNKKLYVGVVCDASSGDASDLTAHMYCYDFTTNSWNATPRLSFDLDYPRHPSSANFDGSPRYNALVGTQWHPWSDNYNTWVSNGFESYSSYAQPIFSDIEFDDNGDVIIGLMDRGSLQMGHDNYRPGSPYGPGGTSTLVSYINAGDLLRAGLNDKSTDPTFTIENAGITNGIHKTKVSTRPDRQETIGFRNGTGTQTYTDPQPSGPGGLEFYWGERTLVSYDASFNPAHWETTLGGLAVLRGSGEVVLNVMDPQYAPYAINRMGMHKLSNSTGARTDAKLLADYDETGLGKATALGDIEICCQPPPIQIGNFVWLDLDQDGIQDPCEPPIPNVTTSLYLDDGAGCCTYVSSNNTDADGQYYFDDLDPNTTYHVVVGDDGDWNTADNELSANGNTYSLTTADSTQVGNTTDPDNIDSDGTISNNSCCADGHPTATITTGEPGETNHGLDFGFFTCDADAGDIVTDPVITDFTICKGEDLEDGSGTSVAFDSLYTASDEENPGDGYDYVFILANTSGEIITYQSPQADFDFTTLNAGTYNIYGLSYDTLNSPSSVMTFLGGVDGSGDPNDNDIMQIRDTTGYCLDIDSLNVSGSQVQVIIIAPSITASADVSICNGETTNLSASGGTSYTWSPSTGLSASNISNPTATPTATTTYVVSTTDADGCTNTDTVVVTVNAPPTVTATITDATCTDGNANNDGTITLVGFTTEKYDMVTGSTYTASATYATATNIPTGGIITNTLANPSATQDYTIRVFNSDGCYIDRTVTINEVICEPECPPNICLPINVTIQKGTLDE